MRTFLLLIIFLSFFLPGLIACGEDAFVNNDNDIEAESKVSRYGATTSHTDSRRGTNCMDCHFSGNNKFVYRIAGTVYMLENITVVYPNATIKLYSGPNATGTLLRSIAVDGNGNFYTTEPLDFSGGVYPVIEGAAGEGPLFMTEPTVTGECNSCHGESTLPITIG